MKDNPNTLPYLKTVAQPNLFTRIHKWTKSQLKKMWAGRKKFFAKFWKIVNLLLKVVSRAMAGAIVFAFMAELAPALREHLPHFYEFVDLVLKGLEFLAQKALEGINF